MCGQHTMQAIQGTATCTNETNKHCIAIAAQPAGIKAGHCCTVRKETD